ncbi:hypothetical protein D3C79_822930 [compost metagenome]
MILSVGGVAIKQPQQGGFKVSRYNITKSGRVANGDMTMELIAKKMKFFFTYEVISGKDLSLILSVIDSSTMFFDITYEHNGMVDSRTVYVGEIGEDYYRVSDPTTPSGWYFKNFTFNLIER